jgi:hypothetical protein
VARRVPARPQRAAVALLFELDAFDDEDVSDDPVEVPEDVPGDFSDPFSTDLSDALSVDLSVDFSDDFSAASDDLADSPLVAARESFR